MISKLIYCYYNRKQLHTIRITPTRKPQPVTRLNCKSETSGSFMFLSIPTLCGYSYMTLKSVRKQKHSIIPNIFNQNDERDTGCLQRKFPFRVVEIIRNFGESSPNLITNHSFIYSIIHINK